MRRALVLVREILWRDRGDPETYLWHFVVNGLLASPFFPPRVRVQLYRLCGIDAHRRAIVRHGVTFRSRNVHLGASSLVGFGAIFDVRTSLTIGENVAIGAGVKFIDTDHEIGPSERRAGVSTGGPITVGRGARVSTGSIIFPTVTIGDGAMVGAGSVVRKDVPADELWAGVPARKIRAL